MSVFVLPTRQDVGSYILQVELDGTVYEFFFQYNSRDGFWYTTIRDVEGVDVISGLKVVTGFPINRLSASYDGPFGSIVAVDTTGQGVEAGLEDLGDTVQLTYSDIEEILSL